MLAGVLAVDERHRMSAERRGCAFQRVPPGRLTDARRRFTDSFIALKATRVAGRFSSTWGHCRPKKT